MHTDQKSDCNVNVYFKKSISPADKYLVNVNQTTLMGYQM